MEDLLKFITCGSVDDGKSTLIGHMLYDAKLIFADQKRALELDSRIGSREGNIDYSLLLDGLMAEREQGITIDVAYRYFNTEKRSFIVADTPGHEEYTRNMAVGASFADLAIILVDASKGVLVQTRRHTRICSLMGIKHFIFAINKMDLINYNKDRYNDIADEINEFLKEFTVESSITVPVSATEGDNVNRLSVHMPWHKGTYLLDYLENVDIKQNQQEEGFFMPVQRVCRPNHAYRGFQGKIAEGVLKVGDELTVLPSGEGAKVKTILNGSRNVESAGKGQAVSVQLDREIDISRGCVLQRKRNLKVGKCFIAKILWMDDEELVPGKAFYLKIGTRMLPANVQKVYYKIDVNTGHKIVANYINKNDLIECEIVTADNIVFDIFKSSRALGSLILIDRVSNMTSACGTVEKQIEHYNNLFWSDTLISRKLRAEQKNQNPLTLWFTGLSGSGKSTLANELEKILYQKGYHTMVLDGDNIRMGLNKDLGFDKQGRIENIRRIAEVSKLMNDAGLIVLTAFISPFMEDRKCAREIIGGGFIEIHVNTSLEICETRDVKGLYRKAREGSISDFTGVTSEYEMPDNPEITVDGSGELREALELLEREVKKFL